MKRILWAFLLPAFFAGCRLAKPGDPIARVFDRYVGAGHVAGVVSAISGPDYETRFDCAGYADLENRIPMRPDTLFAIFSMTKTLTGAAILIAMDEGRLSLDDRVSRYLPEFATMSTKEGPLARELTIRDLMTHMTGSRNGGDYIGRPGELREIARAFAAEPLAHQPGAGFAYGNLWIDSAAAALEVAVGMPYPEYLQTRVLDPLGMKDTTFWPTEEQLARLVKAYTTDADRVRPASDGCAERIRFPKPAKSCPAPSGGLFSTAADMIRFSQMLAHHGEWKGRQIISRRTFDEFMAKKQTPPEIFEPYSTGAWIWGDWLGHEGAMRTDERANLRTGHSRVFMIQTENRAGKAFHQLKNEWHAACDELQGTPATVFGT